MPKKIDELEVSMADGILRLCLNRPSKKNAVTQAMWSSLAETILNLGDDPTIRVVVLQGKGADFCAGADITEFENLRQNAVSAKIYENANSLVFSSLRNAPFPVIAAISGICFGGGFGLAAASDIRIATSDAQFSVPAARLGLAYPFDAMTDIVSAAGPQMAKWLTYSGAKISAQTALETGFLLETAPDRNALKLRVEKAALMIAQNAPLSIRASKAAIRATLSKDPEEARHAQQLGHMTFESDDYAEGRAAFAQKRRPVFKGK